MHYADDPRFSRYVLENSYVLGVHLGVNWAVIELDACLSNEHPEGTAKSHDEWAAFRPLQLWFKQASIESVWSGAKASLDADDTWDYGEIDRFELHEDGRFEIEGEFGRLRGTAREIYVKEFSNG